MFTKSLAKNLFWIVSGLTVYHVAGCNVTEQLDHLFSNLATIPGLGG